MSTGIDVVLGSRRNAHAVYALYASLALLALPALPAAAWASPRGSGPGSGSGGSAVTPPPAGSATSADGGAASSSTASTTAPAVVEIGDVTAAGNGVTLQTSAAAALRRTVTFSGTAPRARAGATVEIQLSSRRTKHWTQIAASSVGANGSFAATWRADQAGVITARAVVVRGRAAARTAAATASLSITVYRSSLATQYGPGFYGRHTACGERLRPSTIGVANRTLKCGTQVAVYYQGRMMVVPVIDRGPYGTRANWDLTEATGRALGMVGTERVGAVSVPGAPAVPAP